MTRYLLAIAAALELAAAAFGQPCPNGQCQRSGYAPAAAPAPATVTVTNEGMAVYRAADGSYWAAGSAAAPCVGGACPVPPRFAPVSQSIVSPGGAVDALDEVNVARARRGLPPFARDDNLTIGAANCASFRAARLMEGHSANDFAFAPPGTPCSATGCAAWHPSLGWGSCCTYDGYRTAGAAWAMGADGKRYMSLFVR